MDLVVRANELHEQAVASFKVSEKFAYDFIMKVKQIRDERLYKELGFSSFDDYCEQAWSIKRDYMDQRIQIADSFGEGSFADTYRQLGHSKSLLLARMEPEIRQQIESTVNVNDATVKQLKEAQKALQEAERRAQEAEARAIHNEKLWKQEMNKPPQVVYRQDETTIKRQENEIKALKANLEFVKKQLDTTRQLQESYKKDAKEYEDLKKKIEFLHKEKDDISRQIESATALSGLAVKIDNFLKTELAPIRYSRALERLDSEVAVRNLTEIISAVEQWCEDMRRYLPVNGRRKVVIDYEPAS